ncbi:MAG TPA: class I mannose-6-phosphate isomerase [Candidatus Blautia excrementipullorum]|nr:class I mannose-6-phosphate isomerase [Candidatus Blautia excrementipullorum]
MEIDKSIIQNPLLFQNNRIQRFYIGGKLLNEWRKEETAEDSHMCEELLVTSIGAISKGEAEGFAVSKTIESQGNLLLSNIIAQYPNEILGEDFQKYNPGNLSVLARVGDTKVRLVMQCHPRKEDAKKYFHMPMGKTEAWYIAKTRDEEGQEPCVYAGFQKHVTPQLWKELIEEQDVSRMLKCLHRIPVKEGQMILIPAGMPHCVGPNCLFLEFHECNDVTIRVEKHINGMTVTEEEMYNGLSQEDGLTLFDYTTYSEEEIRERVLMKGTTLEKGGDYQLEELIGRQQNDSFGVNLLSLDGSWIMGRQPYHRIVIAVDGDIILETEHGRETLIQGHGALIPAECGEIRMTGTKCKAAIGIPFLPN